MIFAEPVTRQLAAYVVNTSFEGLPVHVVESAKMTVLDSITCALGGHFTPAGKIIVPVVQELGGSPESSILGTTSKTNILLASMTNSMLANALDYDDYFPISHPGATIVPPGLAVSEACRANGKDFLTAIIVANEVYLRIMRSLLPSEPQRKKIMGFGTHQVFGAAIAAGRILELDEEQMAQALGIAGANAPVASCAKTVWGMSVTMVKNNYGIASFAGVLAAKLAKAGFTGPLDIFEGDTGFWRMAGSDRYDPSEITHGLGSEFLITQVGFKPYPCCRWIHPTLDAVSEIMTKNRLNAEEVEAVEVGTHALCMVPPFSNPHPRTFEEAQFSIKYLVALTLLGIPRGPLWYDPATMNRPDALSLAGKVTLVEDNEVESCFPERLLGKVRIRGKKGDFAKRVDFPKGEPQNPLEKSDLEAKFRELVEGRVSPEYQDHFLGLVWNLERLDDIGRLTSLVRLQE